MGLRAGFRFVEPTARREGRLRFIDFISSEPQNNEYRTAEFRRVVSLCSFFFYKIDRIHSFDIRYSLFVIRYFIFQVSFLIRRAVFWLAAGLNPVPAYGPCQNSQPLPRLSSPLIIARPR